MSFRTPSLRSESQVPSRARSWRKSCVVQRTMTLLFRSLQRYSRLGKDLFLLAFDTLMWRPPNRERKKVLIVVRLDAIGDFVIWQTYASAIRAGFPDFNIVLVG